MSHVFFDYRLRADVRVAHKIDSDGILHKYRSQQEGDHAIDATSNHDDQHRITSLTL